VAAALATGVGVCVLIAAWWITAPDTGPAPAPVAAPARPEPAPTVVHEAPEVAAAAPPPASPHPAAAEEPVAAREAAFQERLEAYRADVQRAVDCDALFDRHVEPLLRIEEALLSERLQGPEHLERRESMLGTYDAQLAELLEKGECP
jgi:hypothetical protein